MKTLIVSRNKFHRPIKCLRQFFLGCLALTHFLKNFLLCCNKSQLCNLYIRKKSSNPLIKTIRDYSELIIKQPSFKMVFYVYKLQSQTLAIPLKSSSENDSNQTIKKDWPESFYRLNKTCFWKQLKFSLLKCFKFSYYRNLFIFDSFISK